MQDRYAGDIGDFGKLGLLRAVCGEGFRVGINWYHAEPLAREAMNRDGKITIPEQYSVCDRLLYEALYNVSHAERSIRALEKADLIPDALYYSAPVPVLNRSKWHENAMDVLSSADLVFLDPDNGLLPGSVRKRSAKSVKYVFYEEVAEYLRNGKSVLIYNHRNRKKTSDYFGEIYHGLSVLTGNGSTVSAITFPKGSVRDYFAVAADTDHSERLRRAFEQMAFGVWGDKGLCRLQPLPYRRCPDCENDRLIPIVYGMPTREGVELEEKGRVVFGGCCIEENAPRWQCPRCKKRF